ncbi:MAG: PIN domain-containing protein, partial [Candidatus Methylumidiphilus sp.]
QIHQLMKDLQQFSQVVICYAQSGAKIPIDWIMPLTQTVNSNRLKIFKTPGIGKNAADFGITFWAGVLMQQLPQNTHFTVVSEDTDLDHVINLLKSQGRTAERINTKKEELLAVSNPSVAPSPIQSCCVSLLKNSKNRPVKPETLLNHINSGFKDDTLTPEMLIEELIKQSAISVANGRITYNEPIITRLANS